ncbi:amino acid permease [Nonomuraea sp. 10N515B]|uniref:amino acid permease n=1 Tax=Nonomuraea sp. 10N515B TaxID=3457422 RepID=UPI003FCD0E99
MATALLVGNMIGSGAFLLPAFLAAFGSASLLAWGSPRQAGCCLRWSFARLGRAHPKTGGPYAYVRRAFGDFLGFRTAWGYWIAVRVGSAAIAVALVNYLGYCLASPNLIA